MGFNINLKLDFDNIKLDKMYDDANKSKNMSMYNSNSSNMNTTINNANTMQNTSFTTETVDLSLDSNSSKAKSVTNNTPNVNSNISSNNGSINESVNLKESTSINSLKSSQNNIRNTNNINNPNSNFEVNTSNTTTRNTIINNSSINNQNSTTTNVTNNIKANNLDLNGLTRQNTSQTNINVNSHEPNINNPTSATNVNNSNINNMSSIASTTKDVNNNQTTNTINNNSNISINNSSFGTLNNSTSNDTNHTSEANSLNQNISSSSPKNISNASIIQDTSNKILNNMNEDDNNYQQALQKIGLSKKDIARVLLNKISIEDLLLEIESDPDSTRRKKILEASYLQIFKLNFNNIDELKQAANTNEYYNYLYNYITDEVNHYFTFIDPFTSKSYFSANLSINKDCLNVINIAKEKFKDQENNSYKRTGMPIICTYNLEKDELVDVLYGLITGQINLSQNGDLKYKEGVDIKFTYDTLMLEHYLKWKSILTNEEKQVINYLYTKNKTSLYNYLNNMSNDLDKRWLKKKTLEDQEYASSHPKLASAMSIFVTPIEGISAACYSMNSYFNKEKIMRSDVYSMGNIMRSKISQDIAKNYGEGWSFIYDTGMSMADSATMLGLTAATGGAGGMLISATTMGSRSYVSTINNALDRGLSDGKAIALAWTNAATETVMERISTSHLLNLDKKLYNNSSSIINKIFSKISNKSLANETSKTAIIMAGAVSQGLVEGEEELSTQIINYITDNLISGNLSNHSLTIESYIKQGHSKEKARELANLEFIKEIEKSFLGGFISGIAFGSFGSLNKVKNASNSMAENIIMEYQQTTDKFGNPLIRSQYNGINENIKEYLTNLKKYSKEGISIYDYLTSKGEKIRTIYDKESLALYFKDPRLFLLERMNKLKNSSKLSFKQKEAVEQLYNRYATTRTADLNFTEMFNDIKPYLDKNDINTAINLENSKLRDQTNYTREELKAIFNYTHCGGFEINSWLNNTKGTRLQYLDIPSLQNEIAKEKTNKFFPTTEGDIIECLDRAIAKTNYEDNIIAYRGLQSLFNQNTQLDPKVLKKGAVFSSQGYQSASVLLDQCYGARKNGYDIILQIIVPKNSGTAAYIEPISGTINYCQTEILIKRNAEMTVIDNPYEMIIGGAKKTIIPVIISN